MAWKSTRRFPHRSYVSVVIKSKVLRLKLPSEVNGLRGNQHVTTRSPSTRRLLDGVAMPVPRRSTDGRVVAEKWPSTRLTGRFTHR